MKDRIRKEPRVTRFEVIDETGRAYVRDHRSWHGPVAVAFLYQDDGRTLKVFVKPRHVPDGILKDGRILEIKTMPLDKSGRKSAVGNNIRAEVAAGKPRKQAIAIALSVQRRGKGRKDAKTRPLKRPV